MQKPPVREPSPPTAAVPGGGSIFSHGLQILFLWHNRDDPDNKDTSVSDRCLIDVDPKDFAIWEGASIELLPNYHVQIVETYHVPQNSHTLCYALLFLLYNESLRIDKSNTYGVVD